jgi:hypothetical protein
MLLVTTVSAAQTSFLKEAVARFDKALVTKDTAALKQVLHKDLSYGHSNAWVETKTDLLKNLYNGKITYKKIETMEQKWVTSKEWASVRSTAEIDFVLDGKEGHLKLHVLQVWMKTNKGWQLLARQSTKSPLSP